MDTSDASFFLCAEIIKKDCHLARELVVRERCERWEVGGSVGRGVAVACSLRIG